MVVSTDSVAIGIAEETVPGTAPTGVYDILKITGEGLNYEVNTTLSNQVGGLNRGVKDDILVGAQVSGNIDIELSKHKAFEMLFGGALGSDYGADPLTVTPALTANQIYNYTTVRPFTIEKRLPSSKTEGLFEYHVFTGCVVGGMTISIAPGDPITASFEFMGNKLEPTEDTAIAGDAQAGSGYAEAGTNPVFTAPLVSDITLLNRSDDSPVDWTDSGCFTSLELAIANNVRGRECIGTLGLTSVGLGRFEVEAAASMYYSGVEPLDALVDRTEFKLQITMVDSLGNSYEILLDRVKISTAVAPVSGTNEDVMVDMTIAGLENSNAEGPYTMFTTVAPAIESAGVLLPRGATAPPSVQPTAQPSKAKDKAA